MNTNYTSAKPLRTVIVNIICTLFYFFIGSIISYSAFMNEYVNLAALLLALLFLIPGIICLKAAIKIKRIRIDDEGVELLSYKGVILQRIDFREIDTCVITNKGLNRISAKKMILTSKDNIKLVIDFGSLNSAFSEALSHAMRRSNRQSSYDENDYFSDPDKKRSKKFRGYKLKRVKNFKDVYQYLKQEIAHKAGVKIKYKPTKGWIAWVVFSVIGSVIFIAIGIGDSKPYEPMTASEVVEINGTLNQKLKIYKEKSSRRSEPYKSIHISLNEYDNIKFDMEKLNYPNKAQHLINTVNVGDTLILTIDRDFYEKKILKTKQLSFTDKYVLTPQPKIVGLRFKDEVYLYPKQYDVRAENKHGDNKWFGFILGAFCILLGIDSIYEGVKQTRRL